MERFQMSRSGCRPYNYTCGMNAVPSRNDRSALDMENCHRQNCGCMKQNEREERDSCKMPGNERNSDKEMYSHLKHLEPAMAYVPCQEFAPTFELRKALQVGTVFPELCKPFCGRRGGRR